MADIGGGGAGPSNQPGGGGDPAFSHLNDNPVNDADADTLITNIGGGGRGGEVLLNQPGGGGDPVPGAFSEYLATDPNIGGGGSGAVGLSNQPGGGGDPVPGAFSEYLATDANFSIDDVINEPGTIKIVDLPAASNSETQALAEARVEAELYASSLPDPRVSQWKLNYMEAVTRGKQRRAEAVALAQLQPSLKADSSKMLIKLQNEGGGFDTLKAAKNWIKELYPATNFDSLPTAFRGFKLPQRSQHTEIPFDYLTALFPELLSITSENSDNDNTAYDRPRHHCAAAGFCAGLAADYQAIIDSWARFFGLPCGPKMDECYPLARRALALLYPEHPVLGENGPTSFQVAPGPYFRHIKSSTTTVPVPLPPGGLSIPQEFTRMFDRGDRPVEKRKARKQQRGG